MASKVVVFVEVKNSKVKKGSLELLSQGRRFAEALGGGDVTAVLVGGASVSEYAGALGRAGADRVQVAIGVIAQRAIENSFAILLQQSVVNQFFRITPLAFRPRRDALIGRGLIVRRLAVPRENTLIVRDPARQLLRRAGLGHQLFAEFGIA